MNSRVLRRAARVAGLPIVLPSRTESLPVGNGHSPHLRFATADHEISKLLAREVWRHPRGRLLDVGGGTGTPIRWMVGRYRVDALDIVPAVGVIVGDICERTPIPAETYEIVTSFGTYEHLRRPWRAAEETARILKPGGLATVKTVYSWRYHPTPTDYFRFSHAALESIFEDAGLDTIVSGYDLCHRREDRRGGKLEGGTDAAPVDELGGWRENWVVFYAGRKPTT